METDRVLNNLLIDSDAILDGHFYYWKNYHSRYLIDFGRVMHRVRNASRIAAMMYDGVRERKATLVLTPNPAEGFTLAHLVAAKYNARVCRVTRKLGVISLPEWLDVKKADTILLVDDAINTGNSMQQMLSALQERGALCIGVCIAVNRCPAAEDSFRVPVYSVLDLRRTYPLTSSDNCCQECDRLLHLDQRLTVTTSEVERRRLMTEKMNLKLRSAYAEG